MSSDMRLIIAIVHDKDGEEILTALLEVDFQVTRIAATGGFLRRGIVTLLIGVEKERVETAVQLIREHSSSYLSPGFKRATVFVLKVDQFEQL
ncbi:MAG: cyclic-di-AMP receptor [Anaerolineae bacterium]|nr:cyclic-di-AMP receptor [Anaerolineae bacterium]MDK1079901.1 cyclic-di-AMP receptor [Anaerolineae bacterium]